MSNSTDILPVIERYDIDDFSLWAARRQLLFLLCIVLPGVALPIVGLRLFTSLHVVRRWHTDDTLIIIAAIFTLAQSIISIFETGAGEHVVHVPLEDIVHIIRLSKYGGVITYNLATLFIKVSILSFYLRFAIQQTFRWVVFGVMFVVAGYSIAAGLAFLYGCDLPGTPACQITAKVFIAAAVLNVVTDVAILILPVWLLWPMRLPVQYKFAVAFIMMGGGFVVAVSIIRLVATLDIGTPTDPTHSFGWSILWSVVEAWVGLVCACLPCLKAFVSRYLSCGLMQRLLGQANFRFPSIGLVAVDSSHSQRRRAELSTSNPSEADSRKRHGTTNTGSSYPSANTPTVHGGGNSVDELTQQRSHQSQRTYEDLVDSIQPT